MAIASERTVAFLGRLGVSVAVLGSVLALAGVTTGAVMTVLARKTLEEADAAYRQRVARHDLFTPVEQRIRTHEAMIAQLKNPEAKREEEVFLAGLYSELGKRSFELRQFPRAEEAYQRSVALDPENPVYLGDLARLYASAAVRQAEARQRLTLLRNSSDCWESAATRTPDVAQRQSYQEQAANTRFGVALELSQAGLSSEARRELFRARSLTIGGTPLAEQIDVMLMRIGG